MGIKFKSHAPQVKAALKAAIIAGLNEAGGELQSQASRNTRVDTGQLKGSWSYEVNESAYEATVGSPLENAIWEEFGTGEYAINGGGRRTPWFYVDRHGDGHYTRGKSPSRAFEKAKASVHPKVKKMFEDTLRGLGK